MSVWCDLYVVSRISDVKCTKEPLTHSEALMKSGVINTLFSCTIFDTHKEKSQNESVLE